MTAETTRRSLGARTMTEAFRLTVEDNADRVAVRTKDDEVSRNASVIVLAPSARRVVPAVISPIR